MTPAATRPGIAGGGGAMPQDQPTPGPPPEDAPSHKILPRRGEGTAAGGGGALRQAASPETCRARRLRQAMSLPEILLRQRLRGHATGAKFRRQHPCGPYVIDFFAGACGLAIEIDGAAHDQRQAADRARDAYLASHGVAVLRIAAADVLRDPTAVAAAITDHVAHRLPRAGTRRPPYSRRAAATPPPGRADPAGAR